MKASNSPEVTTANRGYDDPSTKYYFLAMMTLTYALNLFDRQLLSMLQESVKAELSLSDTQLGLLTGTAFDAPMLSSTGQLLAAADWTVDLNEW